MAWKQDLEKLKQQLGPEPSPVPPKPMPKPIPKPSGPVALDDEDAVFLSAMGLKPTAPRSIKPPTEENRMTSPSAVDSPPPETFQDAIRNLKGLKPLEKGPSGRAIPPPVPTAEASKPALPASLEAPLVEPPTPMPEPEFLAPLMPLRFQLAAGMAIEVDGSIDLRGHSLPDAVERLKDRLGDGLVLGWRSLQVALGTDPVLHEGLLALLASGQAPMVARYAQAPIPMGGAQAWLLYFVPSAAQP
jgi:hypothetical protein